MQRCNFIGALMLCALADRIFARRVVEKPPRVHLYLDEYQRFATTTTADLLTQGRKYEVGLTLAHQDLHQIRDPYIRNSARHAGTLIVLAVTRPDAEQLAGEFPIEPREEWTETITEADGTEPKLVPSPTAAEDIYIDGHSNPDVDLAARSFMCSDVHRRSNIRAKIIDFHYSMPLPTFKMPGEPPRRPPSIPPLEKLFKSDEVPPRPGGVTVDREITIEPVALNGVLSHAMNNPRATDPDVFLEAVEASQLHVRGKLGEDLSEHYSEDSLRDWLRAHVAHLEALRSGDYIDAFRDADWRLLARDFSAGLPLLLRSAHEVILESDLYRARWVILDKVRQRLRWLWILYEGLAKNPVLIPSGEQQVAMRTRHIVHPAQTQQDALNEFASSLTHPSGHFVAHVRTPKGYFQTKLNVPVAVVDNPEQLVAVRDRSRRLWRMDDDPPDSGAMARPTGLLPSGPVPEARRIGRRPRSQHHVPQEVVPEIPVDDGGAADYARADEERIGHQDSTSEAEELTSSGQHVTWGTCVETYRRSAEVLGGKFIIVSDTEFIYEYPRKPDDRLVKRMIWRHSGETKAPSFRLKIGRIDQDTGEVRWFK